MSRNCRLLCGLIVLGLLGGMFTGAAGAIEARVLPDPIPLIAIVGDSWGMFMWLFRSFKRALDDLGYSRYTEVAN